jgi:hypothetical protein
MSDSDSRLQSFGRLEEIIGQSVPSDYRALILDYPQHLTTAVRAMDNSDSEGFVCDVEFPQDLEVVIALNEEARLDYLITPEGGECEWPQEFLIIGETGEGDYYCVDVSGEIEGVLQYDHQAVKWEIVAVSVRDFVDFLSEVFCEDEDDDDPDNEFSCDD